MSETRINLWSCPRNVSTAFMYSFGQRVDTSIVDEPLYAHYLSNSTVIHPCQNEILSSQFQSGKKVVEEVLFGKYSTEISFFKHMTHHLVEIDWSFMLKMKNIIFIRDPRKILISYSKVIAKPTIEDIGIEKQLKLFNYLKQNKADFVVLDSNELLKNPPKCLELLCEKLNIPFDDKMLSWKKGARKEDGVWAKHWYDNVHNSTGFKVQNTSNQPIVMPENLKELAEKCMPFYEAVVKYSIKVF